jgi:hypothetical protein
LSIDVQGRLLTAKIFWHSLWHSFLVEPKPMPKRIVELTVKKIDAAKPGITLYDGKGLALVVDASGNKRWVLRYTRPDGRRNMIGLGSYPSVMPSSARTKAREAKSGLDQGVDPIVAKKEQRREGMAASRGTFKAVAEEWYAHKARSWAKETARKARESLDDSLFPKLASKPIAEIASSDIKPVILVIHERAPRLAIKARQY